MERPPPASTLGEGEAAWHGIVAPRATSAPTSAISAISATRAISATSATSAISAPHVGAVDRSPELSEEVGAPDIGAAGPVSGLDSDPTGSDADRHVQLPARVWNEPAQPEGPQGLQGAQGLQGLQALQELRGLQGLQGLVQFEGLMLKTSLGHGAYGAVWRASRPGGGPDVAVKLLHLSQNELTRRGAANRTLTELARPGGGNQSLAVEQLRRELRVTAGLFHPNVCATLGYAVVDGLMGVVTELCTGGSLSAVLIEETPPRIASKGMVASSWLGVWVHECACGLAYLHRAGVQHRDLKLDNVLLHGSMRAKICDFGISTREQMEATCHSVGTMRYLAPEVIYGAYTPSADVHSFGMLAYSILHRQLPFTEDPPMGAVLKIHDGLRPPIQLPPELDSFGEVIKCCWLPDAHERPTMDTVQEQLGQIVAAIQLSAASATPLGPLQGPV